MDHYVYLDNSATTKISERVFQSMVPYLTEHYGNPSSIYTMGREASMAIEAARAKVAAAFNASPREIYFTGCGSESDNWAIKGAARRLARMQGKKHIITSVFTPFCTPASRWSGRGLRSPISPWMQKGM